MTFVSSLAKLQNTLDTEKLKRDGWINNRILVITPEDAALLTTMQQQVIKQVGDKLYGGVLNGKY